MDRSTREPGVVVLASCLLLGSLGCAGQQKWTEADVYQGPEPEAGTELASEGALTDLWVTGPSHKVLRTESAPKDNEIWDEDTKTVQLHAARNEFVSFQIVYSGQAKGVEVRTSSLEGPEGGRLGHVKAFREHYVPAPTRSQYSIEHLPWDCVALDLRCGKVQAPREFPVQLVPVDAPKHGAPFDVTDEGNEVVWVDVFVPEDAAAGSYEGTIATGGQTLKVSLEVWSFTLPSVSHFPSWAYVGPEKIAWSMGRTHEQIPKMRDAFDAYFQMAHDHRLVLMEGFEYDEEYIRSPDRRYFEYYTGEAFEGPFAAGYGFELLPTQPEFGPLIEKQGWLNRAFVFLLDEPRSRQQYQEVLRKGSKKRYRVP